MSQLNFRVMSKNNNFVFILMAAVIYMIAQIFKRGVELQINNDLTV